MVEILRYGWNTEHKLWAKFYVRKATKGLRKTVSGLGQEATETRQMAESFFRLLSHKLRLDDRTDPPTREEVREALEQLKDVGKMSVFVSAVILPGGVFSLLGLELLAKKLGIRFSFIPSAFKNDRERPLPPE